MTELYIEGHRMELGTTKVVQVYQINNVGEPKDRQLDYSLPFDIPDTPNNVIILEMLGVPGNTSTVPYKQLKAKLVENGVELIPDGIINVKGKTSKGFKSYIYGGNVFLFDAIGSNKINELDLTSINHSVSESNFINSFSNTEDYIYAISDFGKFNPTTGIEINFQVPSIFAHTLWHLIFTQAGIEYYGAIFESDKFKKLLLSTHRGYNSELDTINNPINIITAAHNVTQSIDNAVNTEQVEFSIIQTPQANITNNIINAIDAGIYNYDFNLQTSVNDVPLTYVAKLKIYKHTDNTTEEIKSVDIQILDYANPINTNVAGEIYLEENTNVSFAIQYYRVPFVPSATTTNFIQDVTNFSFKNNSTLVTLNFNDFIGDLSQISFVKDIMQHFGLIFQKRRNKKAYDFIRIADLISDRSNTKDWSNKLKGIPDEDYKLSTYAQSNRFAYNYLESDSETFADGFLKVNNETLDAEKTLVQRPYNAPTISDINLNGNEITYTPFWKAERNDDGSIKEYKSFSSKNYLMELNYINDAISYGLTDDPDKNTFNGNIPILDFSNLSYNQLLEENYTELNKVLDFNFVIDAIMQIDEEDIQNLDLFNTIFIKQYAADFYINKITYIDSSMLSKVQLVKIKR